ncbi:ATP-binding cassette domain-containing protein [Agrobacterium tumefaciens]|nr:ATP-binding cassette domain-containing protein [Agrobacterium tumefaciens]NTE65159.1 ATP-binding cassette domain-containing protein [Agrobacterium tumefaciens]
MSVQTAAAVELRNLAVKFGTFTAVAKMNLAVKEAEFVAVVSPTGCGKSTIFNVVTGLLKTAHGDVEVFGERLKGQNRRTP